MNLDKMSVEHKEFENRNYVDENSAETCQAGVFEEVGARKLPFIEASHH
jgi:hypothetical protein